MVFFSSNLTQFWNFLEDFEIIWKHQKTFETFCLENFRSSGNISTVLKQSRKFWNYLAIFQPWDCEERFEINWKSPIVQTSLAWKCKVVWNYSDSFETTWKIFKSSGNIQIVFKLSGKSEIICKCPDSFETNGRFWSHPERSGHFSNHPESFETIRKEHDSLEPSGTF